MTRTRLYLLSDGNIMVTLWATKEEPSSEFNKNKNTGLHHVAFLVDNESDLGSLHKCLGGKAVKIEFSPELLGQGQQNT